MYPSKYTPGHKCAKSQIYQLVIEALVELDNELKSLTSNEFQDFPEKLEVTEVEVELVASVLSLHALNGSQGHNTTRLLARIGPCKTIILVDSGSTHNFMDCKLVKQLHLHVDPSCKLKVMVANDVQLATQGVSRLVKWEV